MPHQVKRAVGIDLGTTNSLVATVRGGRAASLPDAEGRLMLPSIVNYSTPGEPQIGEAARALGAEQPADTLAMLGSMAADCLTRAIGRAMASAAPLHGYQAWRSG